MTSTSAVQNDIDHAVEHVQRRLGSQVRGFRVVHFDNGLTLYGFARSFYGKQLALHYIRQATGLPVASNAIEVV
jgi:hypothetical protein